MNVVAKIERTHNAIGKQSHTTKWIAVKDLECRWPKAQRPYDERWSQKIADSLDPDMIGVLSVCGPDKNGKYHVMDGIHRKNAVGMAWGEDQMLPCNVFMDVDTPERAAEIFDVINSSRRPVTALETFIVRVTSKTEPEFSVNKTITALGYIVRKAPTDKSMGAVTACVAVYKKYGDEVLQDVLLVIRGCWGMTSVSVSSTLIRGFARFLHQYGEVIDRQYLVNSVSKQHTPARITGQAKTLNDINRRGMEANLCVALVDTYNHGLRKGRIGE